MHTLQGFILIDVTVFQCLNNGVNYNRLTNGEENGGKKVEQIEIFFAGYPKMLGLHFFPNLRKLTIINQPGLQKLEGLASCPKLTELWVCECDIKVRILNHFFQKSRYLGILDVMILTISMQTLMLSIVFSEGNSHLWMVVHATNAWNFNTRLWPWPSHWHFLSSDNHLWISASD